MERIFLTSTFWCRRIGVLIAFQTRVLYPRARHHHTPFRAGCQKINQLQREEVAINDDVNDDVNFISIMVDDDLYGVGVATAAIFQF